MDLLSLGTVLWCLISPPEFLLQLVYFDDQIKPFLIVTGCYLFYYHLSYLTRPSSFSSGEGTDASGLSTLWPVLAAPDHIREAFVRLCNQNDGRSGDESSNEVSAEAGQDLQTYYDWAFQQPKLTTESVDLLKDSFITSVILCGYTAQLRLADKYSSELLAAEPNSLTYQGSRGGRSNRSWSTRQG